LKQQGLTLIEVMVAVLILSLVMIGVIMSSGHVMRAVQKIHDRTLAVWVADAVDVELRSGVWGKVNEHTSVAGDQHMGQKTWHWIAQANPYHDIVRIDIGIFELGHKEPLISKQSYMAKP
jgi:type II secretion system protein I